MKSIKVNISGREYPLNISAEAISAMQKAATLVNEQTGKYSSAYAVSDPRDLLAMCALQLAFQRLEKENSDNQLAKRLEQKLDAIENILNIREE